MRNIALYRTFVVVITYSKNIQFGVVCVFFGFLFGWLFVFFLYRFLIDHRLIISDTARTLKTNKILIFGRPFRYSYNTKYTLSHSNFCLFFSPTMNTDCLQLSHVNSTTHFHYRRKGEKKMHLPSFLFFLTIFFFWIFYFFSWQVLVDNSSLSWWLLVHCL